MKKALLTLAAASAILGLGSATATELVRDGQPVAPIVIPTKPRIWTQKAADDFAYHIEKMSGARLEIIKSDEKLDKPAVYLIDAVGSDEVKELGRNGFIIRYEGEDLYLRGLEEGASQAAYHLLETMGVRWLWPGELGEVIPKRSDIAFDNLDIHFKQQLPSSRIHTFTGNGSAWQSQEAWKAFYEANFLWQERWGLSWDTNIRSQHSFGHPGWLYGTKYMKTHPEYFNMLPDGTRRPDPMHVGGTVEYCSTCPSSKGLLEQCLKDWREKGPNGYPFGPNLFLGENDASGSCCCPECLAADHSDDPDRLERAKERFLANEPTWWSELGEVADRYMRFYLWGLEAARKEKPDVKVVGTCGYANSMEPPRYYKNLNPDIVLCYTGKVMYPWTNEKFEGDIKCWEGWGDTGATLVWRPNFMLDGHCMPVNYARKFHALWRHHLEHGMVGTEFDSNIGQFGGNGFNYYLMVRMTRTPDLSFDDIKAEYCAAFGGGAGDISDYLDYWEEISDSEKTVEVNEQVRYDPVGVEIGSWNYFYTKANLIYTPEVLAKGFAFLDKATEHASGDELALRRIDFLRKGLRNAELTAATQTAYETGDKYKLATAIDELDKFRATIEPEFIADMTHLVQWENVCWDRNGLKFLLNAPGTPWTDGWKFAFDPKDEGLKNNWFTKGFDDSAWDAIGVDSGWEGQAVGKAWQERTGEEYDGVGWYRRSFTVTAEELKKVAVVTFGACDEACIVWVNGKQVLDRPYPYKGDQNSWETPFTVDITEALVEGENSLAVRVVDTAMQGGLWRPVWLRFDEPANTNPNLVSKAGFETESIGPAWGEHGVHGKFTYGLDKSQKHSGRRSFKMECTEWNPNGANLYEYAWMRIFQEVKVEAGKKYSFRVWYRTSDDCKAHSRIWVNGGGLEQEIITPSSTGNQWLPAEIKEFTVPEGCEKMTIYLNVLGGLGTVWFDDVELKQL